MHYKLRKYLIEIARQKEKFAFYSDIVVDCELRVNLKSEHGRKQLTALLGDAVSDSQTHLADMYARNFSVPVPANVQNPANVEFVAFLLGPDNSVINVRKAQPGDHQDFEEL